MPPSNFPPVNQNIRTPTFPNSAKDLKVPGKETGNPQNAQELKHFVNSQRVKQQQTMDKLNKARGEMSDTLKAPTPAEGDGILEKFLGKGSSQKLNEASQSFFETLAEAANAAFKKLNIGRGTAEDGAVL